MRRRPALQGRIWGRVRKQAFGGAYKQDIMAAFTGKGDPWHCEEFEERSANFCVLSGFRVRQALGEDLQLCERL